MGCSSHIFAAMVDLPLATQRPHFLIPVEFAGAPPLHAHSGRPCCSAHMTSSCAAHAPGASHASMLPTPAATQPPCAPSPPPCPHFCSPHGTAQLTPADPHLLLTSAPRPPGFRSSSWTPWTRLFYEASDGPPYEGKGFCFGCRFFESQRCRVNVRC